MNLDYNTGIPFATNNPSNDQPRMLTNTNSDFTIWTVDHHGFNDTLGGWHNIIHLPEQSADPAPTTTPAKAGQVYAKSITPTGGTADTQLFYESSSGIITQLTGAGTSTGGTNGVVFLPGGNIWQWGQADLSNSGHQTLAVRFNQNFPTSGHNIQLTLITSETPSSSSDNTISVVANSVTNEGFTIQYNGNGSASYPHFYWSCIGN